MPARIEYKKGDKLGPHSIEFIREVAPRICPSGKKVRRGQFICPRCNSVFETDIAGIKSGHCSSCGCLSKQNLKNFGERRSKDLIGKKFGRLTVIKKTKKRNSTGNVIWKCKCDCGKYKEVATVDLSMGNVKSCGCMNGEALIEYAINSKIDLSGQKFGYLLVLRDSGKRDNQKRIFWECECLNCGKKFLVRGSNLKEGLSKSCGCVKTSHGEQKIKAFLLNNNIKYYQEYRLPNNQRFDFFIENLNLAIEYNGQQHYKAIDFFGGEKTFKRRQELDEQKRQYCKNNSIKLIEIPYWDYNNIENILNKVINNE